jgi:hypothetical protein
VQASNAVGNIFLECAGNTIIASALGLGRSGADAATKGRGAVYVFVRDTSTDLFVMTQVIALSLMQLSFIFRGARVGINS